MATDVGTGFIDIIPRVGTTTFVSSIQASLSKAAAPISTAISGMFSSVPAMAGVAFTAAGFAAMKFASDFEDSMKRIQGLVGLSADAVDRLGNQVLELAKTVPVGPVELADALFFITSAGLRGQQAMSALTVSAKAAAAGLGDTQVVADAVTSAMNSYAKSGLTAAQATDIMIAAVREGKLPPEELAGVLGSVLPIASQMGVTFDQVAAAIASSTRQGLAATRAATGIRFMLSSFMKPSQAAVEALDSVGMSIGGLQKEIATQGLLPTLEDLAQRFDTSTAAGKQMFAQVIGGARGLSVATILIGENGKAIEDIFARVENSAGSLGAATEAAQQRVSYQWALLKNNLVVAGTQIGVALLPVLNETIQGLAALLKPLEALIGVASKAKDVLGGLFGALLAFQGLKFLGALFSSLTLQIAAMGTYGITAASAVSGIGAALTALAGPMSLVIGFGLGLYLYSISERSKEAAENIKTLGIQIQSIVDIQKDAITTGLGWKTSIIDFGVALGLAADKAERYGQTGELVSGMLTKLQNEFVRGNISLKTYKTEMELVEAITGRQINVNKQLEGAWERMRVHLDKTGKTVRNFANMTGNEFKQWAQTTSQSFQTAIMDLSQTESIFSETPAKLRKSFDLMLREAARFQRDMHLLLTLKPGTLGLSKTDMDKFVVFLTQQGPAYVDAFVRSTANGRREMAQEWLQASKDITGVRRDLQDLNNTHAKPTVDIIIHGEGALHDLVTNMYNLAGKTITTTINQVINTIKNGEAAGGVIYGQSGFVAKQPTYLVGEGSYPTPFGRGAELVQPLNARTLDRLGNAIGAYVRPRGGDGGLTAEEIAYAVEVGMSRAMRGRSAVAGSLRMADWRSGLVTLDAELAWEEQLRNA